MSNQFSTLAFTPSVVAVQREMGSRPANEALTTRGPADDRFTAHEAAFLAARDGFYLATVTETGWPYVQFRGGPPGFLHLLDDRTLAYADITGNRQYISTGNLRANNRAALFLMDYPHQSRLKILAHVELIPWADAPTWKQGLPVPERGRPERVVVLHLDAFSWNCPQNIPQRWTLAELQQSKFFERTQALEAEVQTLRAQLAAAPQPPPSPDHP